MNSKPCLVYLCTLSLLALLLAACVSPVQVIIVTATPSAERPVITVVVTPEPPTVTATSIPPIAPSVRPAAGEWIAATDFGKLVFTVDPTGTKITKMSYQFSEWTCGPVTNSGTIEASSEWPITDGEFSIDASLDPGGNQTMNFGGTYSATDQKFSGTWEEISHGIKCSGTWEATAP